MGGGGGGREKVKRKGRKERRSKGKGGKEWREWGEGWQAAKRCRGIPFMAFGEPDLSTSIDSQTSLLL